MSNRFRIIAVMVLAALVTGTVWLRSSFLSAHLNEEGYRAPKAVPATYVSKTFRNLIIDLPREDSFALARDVGNSINDYPHVESWTFVGHDKNLYMQYCYTDIPPGNIFDLKDEMLRVTGDIWTKDAVKKTEYAGFRDEGNLTVFEAKYVLGVSERWVIARGVVERGRAMMVISVAPYHGRGLQDSVIKTVRFR